MFLPLDDVRISYSDYFSIDIAPARVKFTRPQWVASGISDATPGARVRVATDATSVTLKGVNTAKVTREDAYNAVGAVLVDGRIAQTFDAGSFSSEPQEFRATVVSSTVQPRLFEFLMPHGAAVEVISVELNDSATVTSPPPRPDALCVAYGDSITQGFAAGDIASGWTQRLAQRNGWRVINLGYGGRKATSTDGITVGELAPHIVTFMVGYNDFAAQTDLQVFSAEVYGALDHIVRLAPEAKVYVLTPLWALRAELKPISLEAYRQVVRDAVARLQSRAVHLIEGEGLTAADRIAFPDGTHPSDLGNTQMFLSLQPLLNAKV